MSKTKKENIITSLDARTDLIKFDDHTYFREPNTGGMKGIPAKPALASYFSKGRMPSP